MKKDRFLSQLEELSTKFNDTKGNGVTRFSWSHTAALAQSWLEKEFSRMGVSLTADGAGNLHAFYKGKTNLPRVIIGSHLDTVRNGAKYDGTFGLVAALETLRSFREEGFIPNRNIEFIAFAEEEGANFGTTCLGSKLITGIVNPEDLNKIKNSTATAWDMLEDYGLEPKNLAGQQIDPQSVHAYLETHVEQERRLFKNNYKLGVVKAISAMRSYKITYRGESVFAATPLKDRKDPVISFIECHMEIQKAIASGAFPENTRFTVGQISCNPGTPIMVPSECIFTIDIRNLEISNLPAISEAMKTIITKVAEKNGIGVEITPLSRSGGVKMSESIQNAYKNAAKELGFEYFEMNCGTALDAASMGTIVPSGLLLVVNQVDPETGEKYALAEDLYNGALVYEKAVRQLVNE